jgi:hypothetical protein
MMMVRSLPVLLLLLLAWGIAQPQRPTTPTPAVIAGAPADTTTGDTTTPAPADDAEHTPADRTTVLTAQFTAGPRGCRAPPAPTA